MEENQTGIFGLLGLMRDHLLQQQVDLITANREEGLHEEETEEK